MTELTREQQLLEEFKTGLDKDGPVVLAKRVAELEAEVKNLSEELNLHEEEGASTDDEILKLQKECDDAIARAEKAEGGEKKAKASLTKATTPAKPRRIGTVGVIEGDEKATAIEKIRAAIGDADQVQIAFSDGEREVSGLAPVNVAGDAWRDHPNGLMLRVPVEIEGPGEGTSVTIDGYALMLDGKQFAYARRSTPLQIAPGQRMNISDDIIF